MHKGNLFRNFSFNGDNGHHNNKDWGGFGRGRDQDCRDDDKDHGHGKWGGHDKDWGFDPIKWLGGHDKGKGHHDKDDCGFDFKGGHGKGHGRDPRKDDCDDWGGHKGKDWGRHDRKDDCDFKYKHDDCDGGKPGWGHDHKQCYTPKDDCGPRDHGNHGGDWHIC